MINLYSPKNELELLFIKSLFEGEKIPYYVQNDHFGSLEIGPRIPLFNAKMIMVHEEDMENAKELISEFLKTTESETHISCPEYSLFDKIRLLFEFLLFGWIMPGRKWSKKKTDEE
jgi:hypothetical protein